MSASQGPYAKILRELAGLMLAIAGESVTMVKRSAPNEALKLKKQQEWNIYLEFLKVLFNLADRLVAFHLPILERPEFMNGLEDTVTQQLKAVLAPALGPDSDQMEITITIGKAVAESRQVYERFAFVVTEESKAKEDFFKLFGDRIANAMQMPGNGLVVSAATLCANAAIPAMKAVFEGTTSQGATAAVEIGSGGDATASQPTVRNAGAPGTGNEIKLISVMSMLQGEEVETRWGLHPRFRQDLKPQEIQELSRLMNRVTRIVGERYAAVAFSADRASWHQAGHA
ncbi:MAG: hypothetical protein C4293_05515 [Nitrospiraceae bacterium]